MQKGREELILAVASGKGGTGKTTIAVALAQALSARLLDADVEEPNAHLFLKPDISAEEEIYRMVPEVDESRCTFCGKCKEICRFRAITTLPGTVMVFPEMCHGCYGCLEVCPEKCIGEGRVRIGRLYFGQAKGLELAYGVLEVGEPMASPLIKALKKRFLSEKGDTIIDCPPGTACAVLTAVRGADFCLLVTEPSPFGLHDLAQAAKAVRALGVPAGVIVNRAGLDYPELYRFLARENLPLLLEIPHRREIAAAYARGEGLLAVMPELKESFQKMVYELKNERNFTS